MAEIPADLTENALMLAIVIGLSYLITGIVQVVMALGLLPQIVGMTDFLGGLLLLVIAAVFLAGVRPIRRGEREGVSFVVVGIIVAGLVCGVQLVIIATSALGWWLGLEDWSGWTLQQQLTPAVWLFVVTLTVLAFSHLLNQYQNRELHKGGGQTG
ncbi:hypothetical protein EU538_05955 [Candidatus Thorarchaeota archaeon]|nr:MAG: hypothetical protein EU538_05955 [Candidatus Thorarchaeota archaeon]